MHVRRIVCYRPALADEVVDPQRFQFAQPSETTYHNAKLLKGICEKHGALQILVE